jgi:peptidoglycan/xylan/chitin deacetylase (PgdA/CDA1 family)
VPEPTLPYERAPADPAWLGDHEALGIISVDLDAEAPILALDADAGRDLSAMSHQAYGPLVGVPRLLDLFERLQVPVTFFIPGATADRWPGPTADVIASGHEVAFHSHAHRPLVGMSAHEQAEDFNRGLDALVRLGAAPVGYRAPMWQLTTETLDLVLDAGLLYDSSLMDGDQPYVLERGGRHVVELPVHWSLDDWEQYAFLPAPDIGQRIEPPATVHELWSGELQAMRRTGSLCVVTCHPFLSGRPSRLEAVERFVRDTRATGGVAFASCAEVARDAGRSATTTAPATAGMRDPVR